MSARLSPWSTVAGSRIIRGDCIRTLAEMPERFADFILTDPPYAVRYIPRVGQPLLNDDNPHWMLPAFEQMYRALKKDAFCVSFYAWSQAELFLSAWRTAGFRIAGHFVFPKRYASSSRLIQRRHEQAYLLAKGTPSAPATALSDVLEWTYTGNKLHPTQKPIGVLKPLVESFCPPGGLTLDPFCGSASTIIAAMQVGRVGVGIELDPTHAETARLRVEHALNENAPDLAQPIWIRHA